MTFEINRKIGKTIMIGGHLISIEDEKNFTRDHDAYGEWRPDQMKIIIDADLPDTLRNEAIIHEVLEAITGIYDIRIKHHKLMILGVVLHEILTESCPGCSCTHGSGS